MSTKKQSILRFVLTHAGNPREIWQRFFPEGKTLLNSTEWRGKEPRSCGVVNVKMRPHYADSDDPLIFDVEVFHRPKGFIWYLGKTKYDGWTMLVMDRASDGTFLDGHGNPLLEGQEPVWLPYEVYNDTDFNKCDFGEYVGESELDAVPHLSFEDVLKNFASSEFSASITSEFVAPHRHRPFVKIVLSTSPTATRTDDFGTRIVNINRLTPQLPQVILDHLTDLVSGFVEGRFSIKNVSNETLTFIELNDVLVDCTPNERGGKTVFNCLKEYLPDGFLEELAERLSATYEVDVTVVHGPQFGLMFRHVAAG